MNYDELMAQKMPAVRAHAAAIGLGVGFGEKKADLVNRIVSLQQQITKPEPKLEPVLDPKDETLRTKPPSKNPTQKQIAEKLKKYVDLGMILSFPEDDQFHFRWKLKEDSGNIRQPLAVIIRVADTLCR